MRNDFSRQFALHETAGRLPAVVSSPQLPVQRAILDGFGDVVRHDDNQLEDRERSRRLAWLPYRLPGGLRLVVSTLPGDTLDVLQPRGSSIA